MLVQCLIGASTALSSISSTSITCDDIHNCRTTASIVYNCISTILLCTWVSLHLNVPLYPWEPDWKLLLSRIRWMLLAIIAPEVVLFRAFRQWVSSCGQLELKLKDDPTCDWNETHGLLARMGGLQVVSFDGSKHLKYNLSDVPSNVDMPRKEEINDRGKGDNIAKSITIIQTLWFAIQAAHRVSQGLVVTELELTTLGHVLLNVFTYWCWWNKPLNLRFPIDVYPKRQEVQLSRDKEGLAKSTTSELPTTGSQEPSLRPRLSMRVRIGAYLYRHGAAGVSDMTWNHMPLTLLIFFFATFSILGGMFGAVHCLAWNSTFPTNVEHIMWRVSSLIVTIVPIFTIVISILADKVPESLQPVIGYLTLPLLPGIYGIARIILLILALIALRDLPSPAYQNPSWAAFIPHIG